MEKILVSIITVCFNSEKTIKQTIESVLHQTYDNIEYIIVDGKSTDRTLTIIQEYQKKAPEIIRYISEPDKGIYDAMNKGIMMAKGDLIGIINSDDFYEKDAVKKMVKYLPQNPYAILYGEQRSLVNDMEESIIWVSHKFLRERMIAHPACFVTRKTYEKFGMFDLKYISVADYDFMLRMSAEKEVVFVPVYEIISNFRSGGMCSTKEAYYDLLKLRKDYGMLSKREYNTIMLKDKILRILKGNTEKK